MKKTILIILLGLSLLSCSDKLKYKVYYVSDTRSEIEFKESSIEVDNILLPYVKEFFNEAYNNGIDVENISKTFQGIYLEDIQDGINGITFLNYPDKSFSLINNNIKSTNKLRLTIFHELAHKYIAWGHCHTYCNEIMSSTLNFKLLYSDWNKRKEILFKNTKHKGLNLK
jgi:hypothetical protein